MEAVGSRQLGARSHERAVANARTAATELSRLRVERAEIELYVAQRAAERRPTSPPDPHPRSHPAGGALPLTCRP